MKADSEMAYKKWYQLLGCFFREYRFTIALFFLFAAIYVVIFFLYDLPLEAVLYAASLCLIAAAIIFGIRFFFYCKRYTKRQELLQYIENRYEELPEPFTLAEKDYSDMILTLGRINVHNLTESRAKERESIDYYTTWVHQIKTPISAMDMILQSEDTKEHRELLAELFHIEQYVEMVLSYLRLGSQSTDFVFQRYELDGIIRQAVHKYASQFVRRRIRLIYEPVEAMVLTDEKWLLFIIEQLLSNAIKYTAKGTIKIELADDMVLKISDTGIGIAPEDLPRIFEKGFTGYNGHAHQKSTGLGLYLCRQAAEKLGICISVESTPGEGTTFFLDLKTYDLEIE